MDHSMNMIKISMTLVIAVLFSTSSNAHDAFKEPLEKRYGLKTVSCKTCHPNNKDRSIHNEFGKLIEKELIGKDITKKFKEAEKKGDEAVKEYEKEMALHFIEAMKKVTSDPEIIAALPREVGSMPLNFGDETQQAMATGTALDPEVREWVWFHRRSPQVPLNPQLFHHLLLLGQVSYISENKQ